MNALSAIAVASFGIFQTAQAQNAPANPPIPSEFIISGTYFDSEEEGSNPRDIVYTLGTSAAITDGFSSGSFIYTKKSTAKANLQVNVSYADEEMSENSQITYVLTFTSAAGGTCTFSGSFSGSDEDGSYSGTVYNGVGTFTLTAGTGQALKEWRLNHFDTEIATGDAADDADFDHDGIPNLVEYTLGTSPSDGTEATRPTHSTTQVAGKNYLTLSIERARRAPGVDYVVEVSSSLTGSWSSGAGATTVIEDHPTTLTVRDRTAAGPGQPKRFIRLKVVSQ